MKELSLSYRHACLHCTLSDKELSEFIQEKKRSSGHLPIKYAVSHVGLQQDGTWVLGANVCINSHGEKVALEDSSYVWIGDLYQGVGVAASSQQCKIAKTLTTNPLCELIALLEETFQHNFFPCVLMMAGKLHEGCFCPYHNKYIYTLYIYRNRDGPTLPLLH